MKSYVRVVSCVFAMFVAAGCASTSVKQREILVTEKLPRPDHILVYDFIATAGDVPADSSLTGQNVQPLSTQTAEEAEAGQQLGAQIAAQLVEEIGNLGLPALRAPKGTKPRLNDIVIRGYLLSVQEGDAAKRVVIGFGAGASELETAVEGYQMTAQGLRKLGSGTLNAGGGKSPGAALGVVGFIATANPVGLIVGGGMKAYGEMSGSSKLEGRAKATAQEIIEQLKPRFQQQGWIN
jgi:hypothetical protein